MKLIFDIEANGLHNPTQIWCVVTKDIDTEEYNVFRNITTNEEELKRFVAYFSRAELICGHNILGYDLIHLDRLCGTQFVQDIERVLDTLILSKLIDYPRSGHSIEDYGVEFGLDKIKFTDFSKWSQELEDYCKRDVDITHKVYLKYLKYLSTKEHKDSIALEHKFQRITNVLSTNGFYFNNTKANALLSRVLEELKTIDLSILKAFPPRLRMIREVYPKETKHGTLHKGDFRWLASDDLSEYNGGPFCRCSYAEFNPNSHKAIIEVLSDSGWSPTDKTTTHIETERELRKDRKNPDLLAKLDKHKKYGWKINEANLETLPANAPPPARMLAKRILLESRRRTLTEWLSLVGDDQRIHGKFYGIGAWTHRMAHQNPNTANIPNEYDTQGKKKLYGKELRSLWAAPRNRLLVGVDAEGIQLRIFAHLIDDKEFTDALVHGKKEDKSDPHSLNQRILGDRCKSRAAAKRFIYALLLGAGIGKLAEILDTDEQQCTEALDRLLQKYTGFKTLKDTIIPADARRGYFIGLDGRKIRIPGDEVGYRKHLAMSGYLQSGEAIVMKMATLRWADRLKDYDAYLVNFVHDEWQVECPNNVEIALQIAKLMADSLKDTGEILKLKCPLAGSYWNDDAKDFTIGTNWSVTH